MTAVKKNVGLFGELLLFVFDICNILISESLSAGFSEVRWRALQSWEWLQNNYIELSVDRCPSAVKEVFTHYLSFFLCICIVYLVLLKALSDGVEI